MKHTILTGILGLIFLQAVAGTWHVKAGATGAGFSWNDAAGDLQVILLKAKAGDEVWVAKGTYYPTCDGNRKKTFTIPAGVKVYGGFAGGESFIQQRDLVFNPTMLSGDIGLKNEYSDNSFTVLVLSKADENNILDGFIIADGNADGNGPSGDLDRCGGGLYIDGAGTDNSANPLIQNCNFQNNRARDGGAVYLNGRHGRCNPTFFNCNFLGNNADLDGGAVFNDGRHQGEASPIFSGCLFSNNSGNYGGAICNYGGKGKSSPQLMSCVFSNNEARLRGGAIFNMDVQGETHPVINNCQFVENKAVAGKAMYTFSKPEENPKTAEEEISFKFN
jgi:hypothetical protein